MNKTEINEERIKSLHALFIELTGRDIPLDSCGYRYSQWTDWVRFGGGDESSLKAVVHYIKHGIRAGQRHEGALKFQNLISDWPKFQDELAECRQQLKADAAQKRGSIDKGKAQVLSDTGRKTEQIRAIRTAGQIAAELLKTKEGFDKLRASL